MQQPSNVLQMTSPDKFPLNNLFDFPLVNMPTAKAVTSAVLPPSSMCRLVSSGQARASSKTNQKGIANAE